MSWLRYAKCTPCTGVSVLPLHESRNARLTGNPGDPGAVARKAGEFLGEMEVPKRNQRTGPALSDLGIDKKESHRFQLLVAEYSDRNRVSFRGGAPRTRSVSKTFFASLGIN